MTSARAVLLVALLGLFSPPAEADLIEADHPGFGPASLTVDTVTGLRWLDMNEAEGLPFDQVSLEFGLGGDFEGFRHATVAEVVSLWNAAGIPCPPTLACDLNVFDDPGADLLLPLIGPTQITATSIIAEGIVAEAGPIPGEHHVGSLEGARFFPDHTQVGFTGGFPDDNFPNGKGHWLVVSDVAPIPEPNAALLFAVGAVVVGVALRRGSGSESIRSLNIAVS